MTATSIALVLGPCFPLLYPVTLLHLIVLYITERIVICYWFAEPPAFDERMTVESISIMRYTTLLMLFVSFW